MTRACFVSLRATAHLRESLESGLHLLSPVAVVLGESEPLEEMRKLLLALSCLHPAAPQPVSTTQPPLRAALFLCSCVSTMCCSLKQNPTTMQRGPARIRRMHGSPCQSLLALTPLVFPRASHCPICLLGSHSLEGQGPLKRRRGSVFC